MLTTSRKGLLLDRLTRDGYLTVTPLAAELGVSEDTLRRDLRDLAAQQKLVRVHGGAVMASPTHQALDARRVMHKAAKELLAKAAVKLIPEFAVTIIDGGTTHAEIAAALPLDFRCTVVTHSPAVAVSFEFHKRTDILLVGGQVFKHSMVANGPETALTYSKILADVCFLGVTGVHPELGLTTGDSSESALKQIMVDSSAEIVVLATPDKLGRASPWRISDLSTLTTLVTIGERPAWLPAKVQHLSA
jgi:DeoR/GlpR family transcriptional regulator of sugar metabolism